MTEKGPRSDPAADLRRRAEELARAKAAQSPESLEALSPDEARRVLHELRLHQIELEMQNEELRRAREELEASRARYFDLYDLAPVGYFTLSEKGLILEANLTAATLLGTARGALTKRRLTRFILPEDQDIYYLHRKRLFETGAPQVCELRMLRPDGDQFWARLEATAAQDAEHGAYVSRVVVSDITERKQAEQERLEMQRRLVQSQKMESLGVLAGGIAHDFNNLLMALLGHLELASEDLLKLSSARLGIERAVVAANRAAQLTSQMLAYSGKGYSWVRTLDLSGLVEENADILRTAIPRNVTFNLRLGSGLPPILADGGQVQQVIMNVISNASEAIGQGPGSVTLATGVQACDDDYLSRSLLEDKPAAGLFVWLEVTDTGCGMDEETRQRMFEPFFTTKFEGRGLGMAAVHGIVRGHLGAILVDSQVGKGTTVRVLFPVAERPAEAGAAGAEADQEAKSAHCASRGPLGEAASVASRGPLGEAASVASRGPLGEAAALSGTVLVVDDESMVRDLCAATLADSGFRVLTAADGLEAVALFREHADEIVCVLLDLTMPRMGGAAAFEAMRRIRPDARVILSSGYGEQEATRRFAGRGVAGFVHKPIRLRALRAEVQRIVQAAAPPSR